MSTTEDSVWAKISEIIEANPAIKISAFRELGRLTVQQSLDLLARFQSGEFKLTQMKQRAKQMVVPEDSETLTFQRMRNKKVHVNALHFAFVLLNRGL